MTSTTETIRAATSPSDLALARAVRAWGELGEVGDRQQAPPLWSRFSPSYRERLANAWSASRRITSETAWQILLRDHQDSIRFDPARVHPSWFVRILEAESPAVRWSVANRAPEPIRTVIGNWLAGQAKGDALPDQPQGLTEANPEATSWALGLWTERLVGGPADCSNDPPIVLALSRFSMPDLARLVRVIGQVKHAFAIEGPGPTPSDEDLARTLASDRVRVGYFRRMIGRADPRLVPIARRDFLSARSNRRRKHAAVGLITVARLLKAADAYRARWATQHIPYSIARQVGAIGASDDVGSTGLSVRAIRAWESWILEAAWARLLSEGRLQPGRERDRS